MNQDYIKRFIFETAPVRGEIVHLDESFQAIIQQHNYPQLIQELLGEALVSTVLLACTIKFKGQLTLQLQSGGPVTLLVAKCSNKLEIRGLAQWNGLELPDSIENAIGEGQLVLTIEQDDKVQPYQSIVPLQYRRIAQAIESYFHQSEQLPTRLWIASNQQNAVGMLIQKMPDAQHDHLNDYWQHIVTLSETITAQELLAETPDTMLHRLYHQEDLRVFDPEPVEFKCQCTLARMQNAIITSGEKEALEILKEKQSIVVTCEYCNDEYAFDKADVQKLFEKPTQH